MADVPNLQTSSLSQLLTALAPVPIDWHGREQSANIEDRRNPSNNAIMEILSNLDYMEQVAKDNKDREHLIDMVMKGYPGQPMPALNPVTGKIDPNLSDKLSIRFK